MLSGDPAYLMYEIPVASEEQINSSKIPNEGSTNDIVWNTNDCEWKITSAYTLSQPTVLENNAENGYKVVDMVDVVEKAVSAAYKTKPEKIRSKSKEIKSIRKPQNDTVKRSVSDKARRDVSLKTQKGATKVSQTISSNQAKSVQMQHKKAQLKVDKIKGVCTKGNAASSTISERRMLKTSINNSEKMKLQDETVRPKIRQGLYRYDFRTFKRNGKRSTKRKESMPMSSHYRISKMNQPSSVQTGKSKPKTIDLNTQLVQSDSNVELVQRQLNTKDVQTDFDENESTVSEPAINETMKTAQTNKYETTKPKIGIQIAYPSHCLSYQERKGKCTYCLNNPDTETKIEPINTKCKICNVYLCKSIWRKGGRSCFERYHKERAKIITESVVGHPPNKEEIKSTHYPVNISIQEDSRRKKVCEICYAEKMDRKTEGSTLTGYKCSICTVGLCARHKDCFQIYHNNLFEMDQGS
ncbi:uncharacterized protein LOC134255427 [Saccostrea cucullata]|uniref:uncharacterized protein LOC134255427 n=1 Tax=Saccostrea cuccullata TaxID=36930 RepID=UPI002ED3B34D